jgi:hypothetical protein
VAGEVRILSATVSGVPCWRALATTDVPPEELLEVVIDVEGAMRWSSAGVTDARVLSREGDRLSYYQYLDVPNWTLSADRYWFLESTIVREEKSGRFTWSPLPSTSEHAGFHQQFATDHDDAVEPTVNVGSWYFERRDPAVAIVYTVCTQPGGSIPQALTNAATRRTLPDTIGDVIREARRR